MSEPWEYEQEAAEEAYFKSLYSELGPQWAEDHGLAPYEDVIKDFTTERLKSYYVAHPALARPAHDSLGYAQSLMPSHSKAALIFAVTATELAVKTVFLKPIVFGLVHTEGMASFITDLATQHTGMERFQTLLTEILTRFGGVDLRTYKRPDAARTLWQEFGEVQKARNAVIHRGEAVDDARADLAIAVAATLLEEIFPKVLARLDLHLHEPNTICDKRHGTALPVYFMVQDRSPSVFGSVTLDTDAFDLDNPPEAISGRLGTQISDEEVAAIRSSGEVPMWGTNTLVQYLIRLEPDSTKFRGLLVKPPIPGLQERPL